MDIKITRQDLEQARNDYRACKVALDDARHASHLALDAWYPRKRAIINNGDENPEQSETLHQTYLDAEECENRALLKFENAERYAYAIELLRLKQIRETCKIALHTASLELENPIRYKTTQKKMLSIVADTLGVSLSKYTYTGDYHVEYENVDIYISNSNGTVCFRSQYESVALYCCEWRGGEYYYRHDYTNDQIPEYIGMNARDVMHLCRTYEGARATLRKKHDAFTRALNAANQRYSCIGLDFTDL